MNMPVESAPPSRLKRAAQSPAPVSSTPAVPTAEIRSRVLESGIPDRAGQVGAVAPVGIGEQRADAAESEAGEVTDAGRGLQRHRPAALAQLLRHRLAGAQHGARRDRA